LWGVCGLKKSFDGKRGEDEKQRPFTRKQVDFEQGLEDRKISSGEKDLKNFHERKRRRRKDLL